MTLFTWIGERLIGLGILTYLGLMLSVAWVWGLMCGLNEQPHDTEATNDRD